MAHIEQRNGKWVVIHANAVVGRYLAKFKAKEHRDKLNAAPAPEASHEFTVTVTGDIEDPKNSRFASAAEFMEYLIGEVTYRVENETPDNLNVVVRVVPQP